MLPTNNAKDKGSILIMVLGILAILSMLGSVLVFMAKNEEKSSREYVNQTRVRFVVESGFETAMAKLTEEKSSLLDLPDRFKYLPATTDAKFLIQSSFGAFDTDNNGMNETAGVVSETYREKGDFFKLKIESTSAKLNINDTNSPLNIDSDPFDDQILPGRNFGEVPEYMRPINPANPTGPRLDKDPDWIYLGDAGYDPRLGQGGKPHSKHPGRLEVIVKHLIMNLHPTLPADIISKSLFNDRLNYPGDRFETLDQVGASLQKNNMMTATQAQEFLKHITLHSWQDSNVIKPSFQWCVSRPPMDMTDFLGDFDNPFLPDISAVLPRTSIQFLPNAGGVYPDYCRDIYITSDLQTKHFETDRRSPIDINHAPKVLIKTLLEPLRGWYFKEAPMTSLGESMKSRAEDWSEPVMDSGGDPEMPFLYMERMVILPPAFEGAFAGPNPVHSPDEAQYYYWDRWTRCAFQLTPMMSYFCGKSARAGELVELPSLTSLALVISDAIYNRIHPDVNGDGIADAFVPFSTWEEFEDFIRDLMDKDGSNDLTAPFGGVLYSLPLADLIIANFNPNSRLNDYNPDKTHFLHIDKSQLIVNTTEFCFHPMGWFEIECYGEVLGEAGQTVSGTTLKTIANPGFEILRLSSQSEFMEGYDPASTQATAFLGLSDGGTRTSGLKFLGAVPDASYAGHALQSFPEPEIVSGNYIRDSRFDGYLQLASWKPLTTEFFDSPGGINRFHVNFNGTLNAQFSAMAVSTPIVPQETAEAADSYYKMWIQDKAQFYKSNDFGSYTLYWSMDPNTFVPRNAPNMGRLTRAWEGPDIRPGNLLADGALSDAGRNIAYNISSIGDNTVNGRRGSLAFWLKPSFDVTHSNRIRQFLSASKLPKDVWSAALPLAPSGGAGPSYYTLMSSGGNNFDIFYFSRGGERVAMNPLLDETYFNGMDAGLPFLPNEEWLPTRSMVVYAGFGGTPYTMGTTSVNQDWRTPAETAASVLEEKYNLETRQWNHFAFSWNWPVSTSGYFMYRLNGQTIDGSYRSHYQAGFGAGSTLASLNTNLYTTWPIPGAGPALVPNYIRFGESSSAMHSNNSADSTYDEIASSNVYETESSLAYEYNFGRFYNEGDDTNHPIYTSPSINLFDRLNPQANSFKLHSVCWTAYWPAPAQEDANPDSPRWNANRHAINANMYNTMTALQRDAGSLYPADPMATKWDENYSPAVPSSQPMVPFSMDIFVPDSSKWLYQTAGIHRTAMPSFAGGSRDDQWSSTLRWSRNHPNFKFLMHWNISPVQTLYASPVLDDITFVFVSNQNRVMDWRYE